jgi:hypothetical protein
MVLAWVVSAWFVPVRRPGALPEAVARGDDDCVTIDAGFQIFVVQALAEPLSL